MQSIHSASPLETLVLMELETLRLEQERLSSAFPVLALQPNSDLAQRAFLGQMDRLKERSNRLERLIEGMSPWGCC